MNNKLLLIIVAAVVVVAAIAAALLLTGNGGDDVPSVDDSVTGTVKVNDYIEYTDDYYFKVTAVDGDKLTVVHGAETKEMTKSEFINLMSAKRIMDDMEAYLKTMDSVTKVSLGSLKFDENKTIDGVAFKIYHADFSAKASQESSGMSLSMDMSGELKFFIDDKGIVQLVRSIVDDVDVDTSNVPSEMKALIEAYIETMEASIKGTTEDNVLDTNLEFVKEIPIPSES